MKRLVLFVLILSMCGCDAPNASDSGSLETRGSVLDEFDWRLREYLAESGEVLPVLPETTVDLGFSEGRIEGSAGCNRYFGMFELGEGDRLTFASEIGSTQMACAPAIARQERRYLGLLPLVNRWQRHEDTLVLLGEDRRVLLRYVLVPSPDLVGSSWQATGINSGSGGVVSDATTHLSTASFADDEVRGHAGCNRFTASYEIDGDRIKIGPAATTRMHCPEPEGIAAQEQRYLAALTRAETYSVRSDRLELRDEEGALQVGYRVQQDRD